MVKKRKKKILPKRKAGQPSKISTIDLNLLERVASKGLIELEIADVMGISLATLKTYKNKYPRFLAAIKRGQENPNRVIANSLFNKARGFEYSDTVVTKVKVSKYKEKVVVNHVSKKLPPDTLAIIFYLTNKMPEDYKHRQQLEHIGEIKVPVTIVNKIPAHSNRK